MKFDTVKKISVSNPGRNTELLYGLKRSTVMLVGKRESHLNRNLCVHIRQVKPLFRKGIWFIGFVEIFWD
jgi:hypothetical protein